MSYFKHFAVISLLVMAAVVGNAALEIGDKAPELQISQWIKKRSGKTC